MSRIRTFLDETPWLSFSELQNLVPEASKIEWDLIRGELLSDTRNRIRILNDSFNEPGTEEIFSEIRKEIIRALIIKTGLSPDKIDLNECMPLEFLEPEWVKILNRFREDKCSSV
ncbi:hypothetical protein HYY75_06155 [bacterium]|nr:hypothetical protein [bacterium]